MGRGRGSKAGAAGRLGLLGARSGAAGRGSSNSTGPNEGLGAGQGKAGTPEATGFNRQALRTPTVQAGEQAGILPSDEPSPKGEAQVPVQGAPPAALQSMAEKVETEVLPAEYREQVRRYMESLRSTGAATGGAATGGEPASGAAPAGGAAGTGEK